MEFIAVVIRSTIGVRCAVDAISLGGGTGDASLEFVTVVTSRA